MPVSSRVVGRWPADALPERSCVGSRNSPRPLQQLQRDVKGRFLLPAKPQVPHILLSGHEAYYIQRAGKATRRAEMGTPFRCLLSGAPCWRLASCLPRGEARLRTRPRGAGLPGRTTVPGVGGVELGVQGPPTPGLREQSPRSGTRQPVSATRRAHEPGWGKRRGWDEMGKLRQEQAWGERGCPKSPEATRPLPSVT